MRPKLKHYLKKIAFSATILVLLGLGACTASSTSEPDSTPTLASESVQETETRPSPSDMIPRITIEELLQIMESSTNILVVDTRDKELYDMGHITGAVSVPLSAILEGEWTPPSDKALILYCG